MLQMPLIFRAKKASGDMPQKNRLATTQKERMVIGGVLTTILVLAAGLILITSGGGTPLTRCTGIVFSQQRSSCLFGLANSTSNASVCGYLPSGRSAQCVSNIAAATKNDSTCGIERQNASSYSECVIAVSRASSNVSYCASLGEPYRSECAYGIATQQNFMESAACSLIGNSTLFTDCTYRNDYQSAIKYKSGSYCSPLPTTQNESLLAYMFTEAPASTGIANATGLLPFINVTPMQLCRYSVAVLTYNSSICGELNGTASLLCNRAFSGSIYNTAENITLQNISAVCGKLPSYLQQVCSYGLLSYIAVRSRNVSVCGQIGAAQYQNACYAGLAAKYFDNQYCTYISNSSVMASCDSAASVSNSTR